ncbi:MAG: hypothetical protein V2A62_01945 [Candidatus Woesearchaeota archaeon]
MDEEKISAEREALRDYLTRNNSSLDSVVAEIGAGPLEQMLLKLELMEIFIQEAIAAARVKKMDSVCYFLGAGAKRVKDEVYGIMIEAGGGMIAVLGREKTPTEIKLTDYISHKYDGGQKQCEFILSM